MKDWRNPRTCRTGFLFSSFHLLEPCLMQLVKPLCHLGQVGEHSCTEDQVEQAGWPNEGLTFRSIWDKHRYRNGCNSWKWDDRCCRSNPEPASPWMLEHPSDPDLLFRWKLTFWKWTQGSVWVGLRKSPLCRARAHQNHIPIHELEPQNGRLQGQANRHSRWLGWDHRRWGERELCQACSCVALTQACAALWWRK